MNPTIQLEIMIDEATSLVRQTLLEQDYRVVRSFDLKEAAAAHPNCVCEHHGTANCTCQYLMLMAFPPDASKRGMMTISLHSHAGKTLATLIDGDEDCWLGLILPIITGTNKENEMSSKTFTVPNISCGHCTHAIQMELGELPGVTHVQAEVSSKKVTVEWTAPANWDQIKSLLAEINYPPAE